MKGVEKHPEMKKALRGCIDDDNHILRHANSILGQNLHMVGDEFPA